MSLQESLYYICSCLKIAKSNLNFSLKIVKIDDNEENSAKSLLLMNHSPITLKLQQKQKVYIR